jgi:tetratricopeptide (TPR) repeat protein
MNASARSAKIAGSAALLLILSGATGCSKLKARDQLVKGVQEFKAGHYETAIGHFQQSIELDPSYTPAKTYLATAYSYQVQPNNNTPQNLAIAQKALDGFNEALAADPNNADNLRQLASIHRNIMQFDQSRADELKVIQLDPKDAEANYAVGVIDFQKADKNAVDILKANKITDDLKGNTKIPPKVCQDLAQRNGSLLSSAQQYLDRAVEINPNYDDAMSYLNLVWRRKADIECGNETARKADIAKADDYIQREMQARKTNEAEKEKKASGGIDMTK